MDRLLIGENVVLVRDSETGKMVLEIDENHVCGRSAQGISDVIGSTRGNKAIGGNVFVSVNVYRLDPVAHQALKKARKDAAKQDSTRSKFDKILGEDSTGMTTE